MDKTERNAQHMYEQYRFGTFNYGRKREKYYALLSDLCRGFKGHEQIYDIGCGVGFWFPFYERFGVKKDNIHGLDLSETNSRSLKDAGYAAECGSAMSLPFHDQCSDATISTGVIHHTPDPFKAFSELARITKPEGKIYVAVYNAWHPYYYLVHKLPFILRWLYWNGHTRIVEIAFQISKLIFQPLAFLAMGKFLDDKSARTLFMDQVITPHAHLFTKKKLKRFAQKCNITLNQSSCIQYGMMIEAIFTA